MRSSRLARASRAAVAALLGYAAVTSCTMTERQVMEQAGAPQDELRDKVLRLEQAVSDLQRGVAKADDSELRARVDKLGSAVAELRQRVEAADLLLTRTQDRTEQLEKASRSDPNRVRMEDLEVKVTELAGKLADVDGRLAKLAQAAVQPPAERAPPPGGKRVAPQAVYDEAYALYEKGKYPQAREKFREYLELPEAPLAANALFWVGESFYYENQFEQAILEYDRVVQKYPKSEKVPSALLKQALAFDAIADPGDARILLKKLLREYPSSDQAPIAKKKLEALGE